MAAISHRVSWILSNPPTFDVICYEKNMVGRYTVENVGQHIIKCRFCGRPIMFLDIASDGTGHYNLMNDVEEEGD